MFEEFNKRLTEIENLSCRPDFKKPKTGDIIDENKSVKWNREEVERLQKAYDIEVKKLNDSKNKLRNEIYQDIYSEICETINFRVPESKKITIEKARLIFNKAYADEHSSGFYSVFNEIEELIDLFIKVLEK